MVNTNVPPPPPPPPPPGGVSEPIKWVYAETQVTAAANVPVKTKDVRPIFAPMVIASGYKGEVVVEANVDARGKVAQVRVIKSQPMLTQAASRPSTSTLARVRAASASGNVVRTSTCDKEWACG